MVKRAHPEGLMSVSEYATHAGINKSTVSRQLKGGLIRNLAPRGKRPLIDPIQADRARAEGLDTSKSVDRMGNPFGLDPSPAPDEAAPAGESYQAVRTTREHYAARMARLNFETKAGELVRAEGVESQAFERARLTRDRVLAASGRMAGVLIAKVRAGADERTIVALIRDVLIETLAGASNELGPIDGAGAPGVGR